MSTESVMSFIYDMSERALHKDAYDAQKGVDLAFDECDYLINNNEFEKLDELLRQLKVDLVHPDILTTIIHITKNCQELKELGPFLKRVSYRIQEVDLDHSAKVLDQLK